MELAGKVLAEEQSPLDSRSWSKWWLPAAPKTQPDPRPRVGRGPPLPDCYLHQGVRLKYASILPQERNPPPRVNLGPRVVTSRLLVQSHGGCRGWETIHLVWALLSSAKHVSGNLFCRVVGGFSGVSAHGRAVRMLGPFQGHSVAGSGPQG